MGGWRTRLIQPFLLNEDLEVTECLLFFRGKVPKMAVRVSFADSTGCRYPMYRHNGRGRKINSMRMMSSLAYVEKQQST